MKNFISSRSPLDALARLTGLRRVPDHCGVTVHRFGRYVRTLGPGWHLTLPALDQIGAPVDLIGHHLDVRDPHGGHAELYYQILEPERAGAALDDVDRVIQDQARDAMAALPVQPEPGMTLSEALKTELNRRIARLGLRVVRCALHPGTL